MNAPAHFQKTVVAIIDRGDCCVIVYLDDIVVHGTCPMRVWEETKLCLERLCTAGFMINLKKSSLLVSTMRMLGHLVTFNTIQPVYT